MMANNSTVQVKQIDNNNNNNNNNNSVWPPDQELVSLLKKNGTKRTKSIRQGAEQVDISVTKAVGSGSGAMISRKCQDQRLPADASGNFEVMKKEESMQENGTIDRRINVADTTSTKNNHNNIKPLKKAQKPRRRVATLAQRRAANIRERRRMFNLNAAFDRLRKKVPSFAYEKRLSRIETLKLAIMYIKFMDDLVKDDEYAEKYKQLTANNNNNNGHSSSAPGAATNSNFLSSGAYLSLYGHCGMNLNSVGGNVTGEDSEYRRDPKQQQQVHTNNMNQIGPNTEQQANSNNNNKPTGMMDPTSCSDQYQCTDTQCLLDCHPPEPRQQYRVLQTSSLTSPPCSSITCCSSPNSSSSTTTTTTTITTNSNTIATLSTNSSNQINNDLQSSNSTSPNQTTSSSSPSSSVTLTPTLPASLPMQVHQQSGSIPDNSSPIYYNSPDQPYDLHAAYASQQLPVHPPTSITQCDPYQTAANNSCNQQQHHQIYYDNQQSKSSTTQSLRKPLENYHHQSFKSQPLDVSSSSSLLLHNQIQDLNSNHRLEYCQIGIAQAASGHNHHHLNNSTNYNGPDNHQHSQEHQQTISSYSLHSLEAI